MSRSRRQEKTMLQPVLVVHGDGMSSMHGLKRKSASMAGMIRSWELKEQPLWRIIIVRRDGMRKKNTNPLSWKSWNRSRYLQRSTFQHGPAIRGVGRSSMHGLKRKSASSMNARLLRKSWNRNRSRNRRRRKPLRADCRNGRSPVLRRRRKSKRIPGAEWIYNQPKGE